MVLLKGLVTAFKIQTKPNGDLKTVENAKYVDNQARNPNIYLIIDSKERESTEILRRKTVKKAF